MITNLPWQVEITENGGTKVFGVILGQNSLNDFIVKYNANSETSLFVDPGGSKKIETYINKIRLGLFDVSLILLPQISKQQFSVHEETGFNPKPGPSGAMKLQLSEATIKEVLSYPLEGIMYIPKVQYKTDEIKARFGEPDSVETINDNTSVWSYSQKNMILIHDLKGKEQVYYFEQKQFKKSRDGIINTLKDSLKKRSR